MAGKTPEKSSKGLIAGAKSVFKKKFLYDVLKTFTGVVLAFWVTEWKNAKQSNFTENTVLSEIKKELVMDITDMEGNLRGHQNGQKSAKYFWQALHGKEVSADSLAFQYNNLLRNFISIQHSAAYESVKSRGLEIIKNDSLRAQIVDLFDFDLEAIEKMEEKYAPHDFFKLYFDKFNAKLLPYIDISPDSKWSFKRPLHEMPEEDKKLVKIWLLRLNTDRTFMILNYEETLKKMRDLQQKIDLTLGQ